MQLEQCLKMVFVAVHLPGGDCDGFLLKTRALKTNWPESPYKILDLTQLLDEYVQFGAII